METITDQNVETAVASFGGEADPMGSLARLFESMPAGSYVTIAKRIERGRTFVVATRQIPGRGPSVEVLIDTTDVDGCVVDTRAAIVLAMLGLEHAEERERRG